MSAVQQIRQQGIQQGVAQGKAVMLLKMVRLRGIQLSKSQQAIIMACTDLNRLDRWVEQVLTLNSADELFS